MNRKLLYSIIAGFAIFIVVILYLLQPTSALDQIAKIKKNPPPERIFDEDKVAALVEEINNEGTIRYSDNLSFEQMVAVLRQNYGPHISDKRMQIRLIEDLIRAMQSRYGDNWVDEMYTLLKAAFPDKIDEVFNRFEKYQEYQDWLLKNKSNIGEMNRQDQHNALTEKRIDLFGKDATQEIWAAEIQNEKITDSLQSIDQQTGDWNQKLLSYKSALNDVLGEDTDTHLNERRQELTDQFLELPSVQRDLSQLNEGDRSKALQTVRKGMGMDADALNRWESLDKLRDTRWDNGQSYMKLRLAASSASEQELDTLRLKYFSPEQAEIIKSEEESGFFRYKEARIYGLN